MAMLWDAMKDKRATFSQAAGAIANEMQILMWSFLLSLAVSGFRSASFSVCHPGSHNLH